MNILFFLISIIAMTFGWKKDVPKGNTKEYTQNLTNEKVGAFKGIAAILIILGHCANALHIDGKYTFVNVGWYCVALFFFLSGYGIVQGYKKKKNYMHSFLKKRAIKVLIPFLVAHIIYIIVKNIMGQRFTVKDILLGMLGQCTIVENSWYPIAAMVMYGAFYLAVRVFAKRKIAICTIFIIIITMIEALVFYEKSWWYISNFAFVVGMIISMYDERFDCWKIYVLLSTVGYIIISITAKYGSELGMSWLYVALPNLKSALLVLLVVAIAFKLSEGANLIAIYLGKISYELYLLHGLCIFVLVGSFKSIQLMLFFILVLGISILGAEIFHSINQKIINKILRVTGNI